MELKTIFKISTLDNETIKIKKLFSKRSFNYDKVTEVLFLKPLYTIGGISGSGHSFIYRMALVLKDKNRYGTSIPIENDQEFFALCNFLKQGNIPIEIKEYDNRHEGYD